MRVLTGAASIIGAATQRAGAVGGEDANPCPFGDFIAGP